MKSGFTLLEILLVIALIAIISAMGIPFYHSFITRNNLDIATEHIYEAYTRAQIKSQAGDNDTAWGVMIDEGSATIFSGTNFASRDTSRDEVFIFSDAISVSGLDEVVFSKLIGEVLSTGTTVLTTSGGEVRNITIYEKGTISF